MNKLVYSYAEFAGVDVEDIVDVDFLERLDFACSSRWGLVIELLIRTFALCQLRGEKVATNQLFAEGYDQNSRLPKGLSPFTAPDYQDIFEGAKVLKVIQKK